MSTVSALAGSVAATSWRDAPATVRDRVVDLVADCVAVEALGSARPDLLAFAEALAVGAPEGAATVVGSPRGWPAANAQLLNGSAAAADQLQDGHRPARGHPASHVVPAVLAVAEERDVPGDETLAAVLAGYEAGVRIGRAMGGTPPGVHDIGTWGPVGVAAGVARLIATGDADAAGRAIELAASAVLLPDATTIFHGGTGGHAFLGASVQLGSALGSAAVAGLEPEPGAVDRHLAAVAARNWDPAALTAGIDPGTGRWVDYDVLNGYVKVHPTCAHLHGVNDAIADLLPLDAADVVDVEVRAFAAAAEFDAVTNDELHARFSVPTSVAVAVVTGRLDETTMTAQTVASPAVQKLADRVRVLHDPALDAGYPDGRPARVTVVLRDGTVRTAAGDRPRGDADRALDRKQLRAKAERLLTGRFGDAGSDVLAAVHALADGGTPRELGERLRSAAAEVPR